MIIASLRSLDCWCPRWEAARPVVVAVVFFCAMAPFRLEILEAQEPTHDTRMHEAALAGDTAAVRSLLEGGVLPDVTEGRGRAPFFFAAAAGHTSVVVQLLRRGIHLDRQDTNGWSALMIAARNGHVATVRTLLQYGADGSVTNGSGASAFRLARDAGHKEVAAILRGTDSPLAEMRVRPPVMPDRVYTGEDSVDITPPEVTRRVRPAYPRSLRNNRTEGSCIAEFVIDTQGRPRPETYRPIRCSHAGFADPARDALLATRYRPAMVAGQPIQVLVQQSIGFALRRRLR